MQLCTTVDNQHGKQCKEAMKIPNTVTISLHLAATTLNKISRLLLKKQVTFEEF
ncbi:hypothetical protein Plhal304r1_c005g0019761 [Plasmopara halstedii]